jgi:hypothetical protein
MGSIFDTLCPPALIYLVFVLTQVIIDFYKKHYNLAITKFIQMIIFTLLLNVLCERGMSYLSWLLVLVPFIFMSFMTALLLYIFKLNDEETSVVDDDDANCKDYGYDNSCQDGDCDDEVHRSSCNNDSDSDSDYSDDSDDDENDNYIDDSLEEDGVEYSSTVYILPGQKAVRVDYDDLLVDKLYTTPSSSEYVS